MKAEERKALHSNVLAQQLGKAYEGFKHGPSRRFYVYGGLLVVAILALVLFRWFYQSSETKSSDLWMQFDDVVFPEQLGLFLARDEVKDKDIPQRRLARFKEARAGMSLGLRDLGTNPGLAFKKIQQATETYEDLVKGSSRVPLLHQEAIWGAAKGYETQGEIEKAKAFYQQLVKEHPESALGKDASKQLERLDAPETKKTLTELSRTLAPPK